MQQRSSFADVEYDEEYLDRSITAWMESLQQIQLKYLSPQELMQHSFQASLLLKQVENYTEALKNAVVPAYERYTQSLMNQKKRIEMSDNKQLKSFVISSSIKEDLNLADKFVNKGKKMLGIVCKQSKDLRQIRRDKKREAFQKFSAAESKGLSSYEIRYDYHMNEVHDNTIIDAAQDWSCESKSTENLKQCDSIRKEATQLRDTLFPKTVIQPVQNRKRKLSDIKEIKKEIERRKNFSKQNQVPTTARRVISNKNTVKRATPALNTKR